MDGLNIPLNHILLVSTLLFSIGMLGLMIRRNIIFILMSLEVMLNAAALAFVAAGAHWGQPDGQSNLSVDPQRGRRRSGGGVGSCIAGADAVLKHWIWTMPTG